MRKKEAREQARVNANMDVEISTLLIQELPDSVGSPCRVSGRKSRASQASVVMQTTSSCLRSIISNSRGLLTTFFNNKMLQLFSNEMEELGTFEAG